MGETFQKVIAHSIAFKLCEILKFPLNRPHKMTVLFRFRIFEFPKFHDFLPQIAFDFFPNVFWIFFPIGLAKVQLFQIFEILQM